MEEALLCYKCRHIKNIFLFYCHTHKKALFNGTSKRALNTVNSNTHQVVAYHKASCVEG